MREDDTDLTRRFGIGPGNSANTHVVYSKHPDTVQCALLDMIDMSLLTPSSGLEMRVVDQGIEPGGNDATRPGMVYLGNKAAHGGYDNRYFIEVESNQTNTGVVRQYMVYCSGSELPSSA